MSSTDTVHRHRLAMAGLIVVGGLLAIATAWLAQALVIDWVSMSVAERAIARVNTGMLASVGGADLDPVPQGEALERLGARLEPALDSLRADAGAGVLELDLYARDGTVVFSGQASRRGRKALPSRVPRLAGALSGTVNTRMLALSPADDPDLTDQYTDALVIYAPLTREGRIVGAVEIYADLAPIRLARLAMWALVVGAVTSVLLLFIRARQGEQEQHLETLTQQAFYDSLTGLPNRALFRFRLRQALHRAQRRGDLLAILFLDLDGFKAVNDSLGHTAGDRLLHGVGERLVACVREEDTVARLGGDEFTILIESLDSVDEPIATAERLLASMRSPFTLEGKECTIRASVGVAISTADHQEVDDVVRAADSALYRAKELGKDRWVLAGLGPLPARRRVA